jgi:hypothetical protein
MNQQDFVLPTWLCGLSGRTANRNVSVLHLTSNLKYKMLMVSTPCDLIEIRFVMFGFVFLRPTNNLQHTLSVQVRGLAINQ